MGYLNQGELNEIKSFLSHTVFLSLSMNYYDIINFNIDSKQNRRLERGEPREGERHEGVANIGELVSRLEICQRDKLIFLYLEVNKAEFKTSRGG